MRWIGALVLLAVVALLVGFTLESKRSDRRSDARAAALREAKRAAPPDPAPGSVDSESPGPRQRIVDDADEPVGDAILQIETRSGWVDAGRTDTDGFVHWDRAPDAGTPWRIRHPRVLPLPVWGDPDVATRGLPFVVVVRDGAGKPVPDARVELEYTAFSEREDLRRDVEPEEAETKRTNAGGLAQFSAMPPGSVDLRVEVVHADYAPKSVSIGYERVAAQLVVVLDEGGRIEGRVLDADGREVAGATVRGGEQVTTSDARGHYALVLGTDSVPLTARKQGVGMGEHGIDPPDSRMPVWIEAEAGRVRRGVDLRLFPVSRVRGSVRVEGEDAPPGAIVVSQVHKPGMLEDERIAARDDGTFETEPFFVLLKSEVVLTVLASGTTAESRTLTVHPGQDADAGEFLLRRLPTVAGRVLGVSGGIVQMANSRAIADSEGRFRLVGVPVGTWSAAYYTFQETTRPAALGSAIELVLGSAVDGYEIRVQSAGTLAGHVVDADGNGVAEVQVGLVPVGVPEKIDIRKWGEFRTDADGRFRADELAPGRYLVAVVHLQDGAMTGFRMDDVMPPQQIDVRSGANEVEIRMPAVGRIRGTLLSAKQAKLKVASLTVQWLEPIPREGDPRLWLSRNSSGAMLVGPDIDWTISRAGKAVITLRWEGHASWSSNAMDLERNKSVELGSVRLDTGRTIRLRFANPAPKNVSVRVARHPGPALYPLGIVGGGYENGVLRVDHAPERALALILLPDDAAPTVVLVPATGAVEKEIRLEAGVAGRFQSDAPIGDPIWVFDRESGHLLFWLPGLGDEGLDFPLLPPRPIQILLSDGTVTDFHPRAGQDNTVTLLPAGNK
ncbi:MAG: hypothetical protein ACYTEG_05795 [Planctomycetota bacterium]